MDPVVAEQWQLLEEGALHDWDTLSVSEDDQHGGGTPDSEVWSVLDEVLRIDLTEEWKGLEDWLGDILDHCVNEL
jgi:hypothetical protein